MENYRLHGNPPYAIAVIHGGPGASGEMAPVARALAKARGILEPLQTAGTVEGQIEELHQCLARHAARPAILIGHSWGAWLALLTASRYPADVRKLILVASAGLDAASAGLTHATRLQRMREVQRQELEHLQAVWDDPGSSPAARRQVFAEIGKRLAAVDTYDPLPGEDEAMASGDPDLFRRVWPEADQWRAQGRLLEAVAHIACPVVAIHGAYDSHPAKAVQEPLAARLADFHFYMLEKCGHTPWRERQVRERFYEILGEACS